MVAYGSTDNPVAQDPFQQIVEVHWTSKYLAFTCLLKKLHGTHLAEHCGPPTASEPDQFAQSPSYLSETEYRYNNPDGRTFNQAYLVSKDGSGAEIDASDISISGMPDLGAATHVSYGSWLWRSEGNGAIGEIDTAVFPGSWWQQPEGDPQGLIVSGHADRPFLLGTSASFACQGQAFTDGPVCYAGGPGPDLDFNFADYSSTLEDFSPFALDLSGVVIVHRSKAYRVIARQIVQLTQEQPPVGTISQQPGVLWVLCERSKSDDPAA